MSNSENVYDSGYKQEGNEQQEVIEHGDRSFEPRPKDKFHFVYFTLLFLGMSMLFAYNSFIASPSYNANYYKYASGNPHMNSTMKSSWKNIEAYITTANMIPNLLLQVCLLAPAAQNLSMQLRMIISLVCMAISILILPILPLFKVSEGVAFAGFLGGCALCGAATAVFQSTAFALAAGFPAHYTQGTMLGIGVSGAGVSLIQIITKAAMGDGYEQVKKQAALFFGLGVAWIVISIVFIILLKRNRFAQMYVQEYSDAQRLADGQEPANIHDLWPDEEDANVPKDDNENDDDAEKKRSVQEERDLLGDLVEAEHQQKASRGALYVVKTIYPYMLGNFAVYGVSLTVFPGLGVAVDSNAWFGIIIVFMFNIGDYTGRFFCRFPRLWLSKTPLLAIATARLLFIPLFCIFIRPRWITITWIAHIVMFLTGITNGFTSSQLMMFAPSSPMLENSEKGMAGAAMSLSLLTGCSVGSLLDLLLGYVYVPKS